MNSRGEKLIFTLSPSSLSRRSGKIRYIFFPNVRQHLIKPPLNLKSKPNHSPKVVTSHAKKIYRYICQEKGCPAVRSPLIVLGSQSLPVILLRALPLSSFSKDGLQQHQEQRRRPPCRSTNHNRGDFIVEMNVSARLPTTRKRFNNHSIRNKKTTTQV